MIVETDVVYSNARLVAFAGQFLVFAYSPSDKEVEFAAVPVMSVEKLIFETEAEAKQFAGAFWGTA